MKFAQFDWKDEDDVQPDYEDSEIAERRMWLEQWAKEDAPFIAAEKARRKAYADGFNEQHVEAIKKNVHKELADEWLQYLESGNTETDD